MIGFAYGVSMDMIKGGPSWVAEGVLRTLAAENVTMADFLKTLRPLASGPVVDETALTSAYNFKLQWAGGEPIADALDQIGLRLEPRKVPVNFFIVDSAKKPSNPDQEAGLFHLTSREVMARREIGAKTPSHAAIGTNPQG